MSEELWTSEERERSACTVYISTFRVDSAYGVVEHHTFSGIIIASIMSRGVIQSWVSRPTLEAAKEWCIVELMKRKVLA